MYIYLLYVRSSLYGTHTSFNGSLPCVSAPRRSHRHIWTEYCTKPRDQGTLTDRNIVAVKQPLNTFCVLDGTAGRLRC